MDLAQARIEGLIAENDCRYGRMEFLRTDINMAQSLGMYGEFSEGEVELWRGLLDAGDIVVSAGANCGAHLVALSQIVGAGGCVISAEPQRILLDIARANTERLGNVHVAHAALGAVEGTTMMPEVDYRWPLNFGSLGCVDRGIRVPVTTVDQLVKASAAGRVKMIHLDVEGSELPALAGAMATIVRSRPLLYVEADRPKEVPALMEFFRTNRYQVTSHQPPLYRRDNFAKNAFNCFGEIVSLNLLAIPERRP